MPENLTEDEVWAMEVDECKHEIKRRLYELGGLIGQEDCAQFLENSYPLLSF